MTYVLDPYSSGRSWLHRLDPRVKLWGVTVCVTVVFAWAHPLVYGVLLGSLHGLLWLGHIPWRRVRQLWQQMALLLVLIIVLQPWFSPAGRVLWALGPLRLTTGGLLAGVLLALRAATLAFTMAILLFTTEQSQLVQAFVRLGLPYTWGLTISLTLRFVPAIHSLFVAVREAQAARGWETAGAWWRRLRDYVPVLVSVIIGTLRLSDRLTLALAARGLGAGPPRTTWRDLHMQRRDWLVLFLLTLFLLGMLIVRFGV